MLYYRQIYRFLVTFMINAILTEKTIHPMAQPQDYIKLIFQSEFGPGHLIPDPGYARNRLLEEWQQVKDLPAEPPQHIGGGYIRLCIKGIDHSRLEEINNSFVASANAKSGSDAGFMTKLELFLSMAQQGDFDFSYARAKQAASLSTMQESQLMMEELAAFTPAAIAAADRVLEALENARPWMRADVRYTGVSSGNRKM